MKSRNGLPRYCLMWALAAALLAALTLPTLVHCVGPHFQADADWEEFEEDEFVVPPPQQARHGDPVPLPKRAAAGDNPAESAAPATSASSKFTFALTPALGDWFYVEVACLVFLSAFAVNYYFGSQANRLIALKWGRAFAPLLESNFSRLGEGGGLLVKESESRYRVPATGRRCCHGLQATLNLSRRHDLFARIYEFLIPSQDRLAIEVALDAGVDPLVFAVVPNARAKSAPKDLADLGLFARQVTWPELSQWFTVFSESPDVTANILNKPITSTIAKYHNLVRLIHISDQFPHPTYKRMMRLEFNLPENVEELNTLMRMVIYMIDYVPTVRLSPNDKARADKKRAKAAEDEAKAAREQRQEAIQQKKAEQRAKEKEKLKDLPPEQQARAEEREARRARKKKMGKLKVVYG